MTAVPDRSDPPAHRRSPASIADDARSIRARMDRTIDEIEFRLSPGQLSGGIVDIVRDVIQDNPGRVTRVIRENPVPVVLIGLGALWLAFALSRTPHLEGRPMPEGERGMSDQRARILLTGLAGLARHGAHAFRRAETAIASPDVGIRLRQLSTTLDRSAAALDHELTRRGGTPDPTDPADPAWDRLDGELRAGGKGDAILRALDHGTDATLARFREALREDLPDGLRVIIGAQFHEVEGVSHAVGALREAVV